MTKERIINVLKHLNLQTTHYRVPVEVIDDAQLDAAAEQILSLMQTKEDIAPELQQANVMRRDCIHCGSTNTLVEEDTCYSDGAEESNCSNHLVSFTYLYCNDCGDTTTHGA
jgi:hypothetical protein